MKGPAPARAANPPLLLVEIRDAAGQVIDSYNDWHPLWIHAQADHGGEALFVANAEDGTLVMPFSPEAASAMLTDVAADMEVVDTDLTGAVREFCVENPDDPDCRRADLEVVSLAELDAPPFVLLGSPVDVTVRTTVTNNGPSTPEDGILETTVSADPELSVTPSSIENLLTALALGVDRQDDQTFQVECLAPGRRSVTITSVVETAAPATVDLVAANDAGEIVIPVDCAVPVTIDIKPQSIASAAGGVIPVILRSTEAGEDGNPVAFDPSSVDIASVRFGDQDTLTAGDGARESHGKGHGRPDLMLHFRLGDSGLPIGHTSACVIGEFALEDGAPATFFGCDGLTVR